MLICRVECLICQHYFHWEVPHSNRGECWNCGTKYETDDEENLWGGFDHGAEVVTVKDPNENENCIILTSQGGDGWAIVEYLQSLDMGASNLIEHYLY